MSLSPWLAVDVDTVPSKRARELRDAWEDFVDDRLQGDDEDPGTPDVRGPIADSWHRSRDAGRRPHRAAARAGPSSSSTAPARCGTTTRCAARAAHRAVHGRDAAGRRQPARRLRRRRHAAEHQRRHDAAKPRRRRHELHRGRAVERVLRGDQRDRDGGRRWPRGPGLRGRALHRARPALDVLRRAGRRSRHRRGRRHHRPDRRHQRRQPAEPRRRRRDRPRGRGGPARPAARARRSPARALRPARRAGLGGRGARDRDGPHPARPRPALGARRAQGDPGGRRAARAAVGRRGDRRADRRRRRLRRAPQHRARAPAGPRLELRVLGDEPPEVRLDGTPVHLRPRHVEMLTILALVPRPPQRRGHVRRALRRRRAPRERARRDVAAAPAAAGALESGGYAARPGPVDSDVRHVRALLDRGAVREAAEAYPGPLLPASVAPGIERVRDELEGWIRQAVITSDGRRRAVGLGALGLRSERPARVAAAARRAGLHRPAPQQGGRADARAAQGVRRCSATPRAPRRGAISARWASRAGSPCRPWRPTRRRGTGRCRSRRT